LLKIQPKEAGPNYLEDGKSLDDLTNLGEFYLDVVRCIIDFNYKDLL